MNKIEHLGIAVKDSTASARLFELLLGVAPYKSEKVESEKVETIFYALGPNKIELLQSTDPDGTIAKFIDKKGEGFHHVAIAVDDIYAEIKRLTEAGFTFVNPEPKRGADNKLICFLHPKSTNGLLVELCQDC
ncbi:MAG: methylmalonyl-CoA epimerase [Bacteroidia bacterium]|jgi:methylmalonyl-CoA/ethylmalonyl-CoA epimerase